MQNGCRSRRPGAKIGCFGNSEGPRGKIVFETTAAPPPEPNGSNTVNRTPTLVLGLAFLASVVAPAVAQKRSPEVAALTKAFRKASDPAAVHGQRTEALAAVRGEDSAEVALALIKAFQRLESECAPIEKDRRKILLQDRGSRLEEMRSRLQPLRTLQERVYDLIAKLDSTEAQQAIAKLLSQKKLPFRLRLLGAKVAASSFASGNLRSAKSAPLEDLIVVLEAVASLGRRGGTFGDYAVTALSRREPIARERAISALAAMCWPGGLKPLIDRLDTEPDEMLRNKVGDALCVLTKQNLGTSSLSWNAWFTEQGGAYLSGERRLGGGKPNASKRTSQGYYFGIPLDRTSILFVHDNSLSMRQQLGDKKRIQRSLEELGQALDNLKPTQKFNIVLLANRVWSFDKKQVKATKRNVARAKAWLQYQPIELGTNIYNALDAAFMLSGRGVRDRYYDPEVDTILLLSDGAPTRHLGGGRNRGTGGGGRGRGGPGGGPGGAGPGGGPGAGGGGNRENPKDILDAVRRWNLLGRIEVHTIVLGGGGRGGGGMRGGQGGGQGPGGRGPGGRGAGGRGNRGRRGGGRSRFMEQLAKQNRGRFEEVSK